MVDSQSLHKGCDALVYHTVSGNDCPLGPYSASMGKHNRYSPAPHLVGDSRDEEGVEAIHQEEEVTVILVGVQGQLRHIVSDGRYNHCGELVFCTCFAVR
jgi:hypothetical protein